MASFTTRVELHNASEGDYVNLHREMQNRGFTRTVRGNDGALYRLPNAEYNYEGDSTIEQVLALARAAANATGRGNDVLVTQAVSRTWYLSPA